MLAVPLVPETKADPIDLDAVRERLQVVRKLLAEECMVEEDATDTVLLDLVMNAITDRIDVFRLQPENGDSEEIARILDLRYKADRRLIETVTALRKV